MVRAPQLSARSQPTPGRAVFVEGPLFRHIAVMTGTASIGMMALFVVDLVDMLFLSMLGEVALAAAIGYAGSIVFFTTSICIGIAISMAALVARAIGAGERDRARRWVGSVAAFAVAVTVPLAIIAWLLVPVLLDTLGADGRAHELAMGYLRIIIPSMPFLALAMSMGGVLRALGDARRAMASTLAGGAVNAALDPVLIFTLGLGVDGAAIASVAARLAVLAVALHAVVRRHDMLPPLRAPALVVDLRPIARIAVPAMLTNVATPVGNAYLTATIAPFGDGPVAGWSVIGRVIPVAFAVVFALSGAIGPILGQNLGAGRLDRVRQALRDALVFEGAFVALVAGALFLGRDGIVRVFGMEGAAAELVHFYFTFLGLAYAFHGAQFVANAAFNNLGVPTWSTASNWAKATLGTIPFVWLGAHLGGPEGAFVGQGVGAVLFGTAAIGLAFLRVGQLEHADAFARGETPPEARFFRVPLPALAHPSGWLGLFRRD